MKMKTYFSRGNLVVKLDGEIDHHSIKEFREELDKMIGESRPKTMILELSGIDFMDSSGLGLVLGRYRKLSEAGSKMLIKNPTPEAERILKMAGVDKLVKIIKQKDA
ncbi:MAG: STAS domain-containing protein [Clostridiales bacterium]|nr:STAS domain-containing protein [Clostridia bacterium]MCR5352794.1 STAS domain-containing protein [Clostridiales bacterium]